MHEPYKPNFYPNHNVPAHILNKKRNATPLYGYTVQNTEIYHLLLGYWRWVSAIFFKHGSPTVVRMTRFYLLHSQKELTHAKRSLYNLVPYMPMWMYFKWWMTWTKIRFWCLKSVPSLKGLTFYYINDCAFNLHGTDKPNITTER